MPTPPKRLENSTKHWTNQQREARLRAEIGMQRETRVNLRAPKWLSKDARKVWDSTKKKLRGLELLDNLDADLLAIYCDAQAHYQAITRQIHGAQDHDGDVSVPVDDEAIKKAQNWARLIITYAEKLGLSPNARARLAKKKAEHPQVDEFEKLLEAANDAENWQDGR